MTPNPVLGILLHAIGGFAAGSFYSPLKKIQNIAWESAWLLMGLAAWLAAPWLAAWMTTPHLDEVVSESIATQPHAVAYAVFFGFLWGFGNLTYGLAVRYLGIALGGSIAVAFCMIFGTLEPPIRKGTAGALLSTPSGWAILAGIALCAFGIALCGEAGRRRDLEFKNSKVEPGSEQFQFHKGLAVAVVAGILSACFAIGLDRGAPISEIALSKGTDSLYKNNSVLIAVLIGGFASNALSCLVLNIRNRTFGDYVRFNSQYVKNLLLVWLAGITWFFQFFFYGMGQSKLGQQFEFSSWTIHMAFIVVFLNLWGLVFDEWRGASAKTKSLVWIGIIVLIFSTIVIGLGNKLATNRDATSPALEVAAVLHEGDNPDRRHDNLPVDEMTFTNLFDGKSLTDWMQAVDDYEIAEGTIQCKSGRVGNLLTADEYDDFIFSFEFRLPPGGNSGLAIRTPEHSLAPHLDGIELQILDDTAEQYESLHEYQYHGSAYGLAPATRGHLKPVGMWNHEVVVAQGDQIEVMLNGFTILDVNLADVRDNTLDGLPHPGAFRKSGHIGFCGHGDLVAFRNIRVARLTN